MLMAVGFLLALLLRPGASYWTGLFPTALLLGAGLCVTVAPLTSTVMGSVPSHNSGIASAINNVVARVAGLLAVAGLGVVVSLAFTAGKAGSGLASTGAPPDAITAVADAYTGAFHRAMLACALLAFASGLVALAIIRDPARGAEMTTQNASDA